MSRSSRQDPGAAADARVRELLAQHGDGGEIARPTTFYFYGGDLAGLRGAAEQLGYRTWPTVGASGLVLGKTLPVDDESCDQLRAEMEALAADAGATFDGWETQMALN